MVEHQRIWYRLPYLENAIFKPSKIKLVSVSVFRPGLPRPVDDGHQHFNLFFFKFIKWLLHGVTIHLQFNKNEENEMFSRRHFYWKLFRNVLFICARSVLDARHRQSSTGQCPRMGWNLKKFSFYSLWDYFLGRLSLLLWNIWWCTFDAVSLLIAESSNQKRAPMDQ